MMSRKIFFTLALLLAFKVNAENSEAAAAQSKPSLKPLATAKTAKQKQGENLLDFEAEVIEGEKKRPELFLDIKAGDGNVGSGLYLRPHYDDFFVVDKRRRPRFVKSK